MQTTKLAVAIATILTGAIAANTAQAQPSASAESIATFTNYEISQSGTELSTSNFSILSPNSTESVNASVNTTASSVPTISSSVGAPLSTVALIGTAQPASVASELVSGYSGGYTYITPLPINGNYAGSGINETGAPITGLSGNPGNALATINEGSYAALTTNGTAATDSNSSLVSKIQLSGISGVINFSATLQEQLAVFLSTGNGVTAKSAYSVTFSLIDTTTGLGAIASSNIPGTLNALTNVLSISNNISDNTPGIGATLQSILPATLISFNSVSLVSTDIYNFTSTLTNDANVQLNVPEPGIVALLGIGLLGMGVSSRKSPKSSQAIAA